MKAIFFIILLTVSSLPLRMAYAKIQVVESELIPSFLIKKDNRIVLEGDIELGFIKGKTAYTSMGDLWPGGIVPYEISEELADVKPRIERAMKHYEDNTVIRFVPRTTQRDYVYLVKAQENSSRVGRLVGAQTVKLSKFCSEGTIIHELGHALGFWHEHSRPDRDDFVEIIYKNIIPGEEHNFRIEKNWIAPLSQLGKYDLKSVMHYDSYGFSYNKKPTMLTVDGYRINDPSALSEGDKSDLSVVYGKFTEENCDERTNGDFYLIEGPSKIILKDSKTVIANFSNNEKNRATKLMDYLNQLGHLYICHYEAQDPQKKIFYFKDRTKKAINHETHSPLPEEKCDAIDSEKIGISQNTITVDKVSYVLRDATVAGKWWRKIQTEKMSAICSSGLAPDALFIF